MNRDITENSISKNSHFDKEKNYWLKKFEVNPVKSYFQYDFPGKNDHEFRRHGIEFTIPGDLFRKLNRLTSGSDNNLFVVLVAGVTLLLNKYTGNDDIVIGSPILRQEEQGVFLNTLLAQRNHLDSTTTFKELLKQTKSTFNEAYENSNYPISRLLYYLGLPKIENGYPLFETVILLHNIHDGKYIEKMNHNMTFLFRRSHHCIEGVLEYNSVLYRKDTAEQIASHLVRLLETGLNDVNLPVSAIEIMSEAERRRLLVDFNETRSPIGEDTLLHELFEDQVKKTPGNTAVVSGDEHFNRAATLTYTRLNEKSNQLARLLVRKGVGANTIVGIMVPPSIEMAVAIIAISKAGGGFLPIDHEAPVDRMEYLLTESHCRFLLTRGKERENVDFKGEIITINDQELYTGENSNLEKISCSKDLFYIIYTSGTTGKPKGGLLTHRNLVNYVTWFSKTAKLNEKDKTILTSSYAFDLGYTIILGALVTGGELHLLQKENYLNSELLLEYIKKNSINYLKMTPSLFSIIINSPGFSRETCSTLRLVVLGGEEINTHDVERMHRLCSRIRIMNHYGPTEATIGSVARFIDFNSFEEYKQVPDIGKPIHNTRVYILDDLLKAVPIGVPGELFIGGYCVARGYLNQPELTAEKFVRDNYASDTSNTSYHPDESYDRFYKTGDLARWLPDGNILFLGRKDNQVKIRGFRVEPGEIENQILKNPGVEEVVVLPVEDNVSGKYLCAYVVPASIDPPVDTGSLKVFISQNLPDFMVPSYFVFIEKIPLTPNGKVDRKALSKIKIVLNVGQYRSPENEIQSKIVGIWSEVLGVEKERIGIHSNFFELGGHSLTTMLMASKIHKAFDVKISLVDVFNSPTPAELAKYIQVEGKEDRHENIEPAEAKEYYALSSAQKRLYILQQFETGDNISYNITNVFEIKGQLQPQELERVFRELIKRHENFRTSFEMIENQPFQRIHKEVTFEIEYYEAGPMAENLSQKEEKGKNGTGEAPVSRKCEEILENFIRAFELNEAPLLRVGLIRTGDGKYILMIDMHHITADGISMAHFINECIARYAGNEAELPQLRIQYKDFSQWQNSRKKTEIMKQQEAYWMKEFEEEIPLLNLPVDYPRPTVQSFKGTRIIFQLNDPQVKALNDLILEEEATLFMVLMSIFNILLAKVSQQEKIVVGTPVHGRHHDDLDSIMGMFVNTLALLNHPLDEKSFREFLKDVKEKTLKSFENQDYQFEDLVEQVPVARDVGRNPFFDVMLDLDNINFHFHNPDIEIPGLKIIPYEQEGKTSKFDLTLAGAQREDKMYFSIEYCTKLFKQETIIRFISYFRAIVASVINNIDKKIKDIEIITEDEKKQLLFDFNDTKVIIPGNKTIHELFEEQVERAADRVAVIGRAHVARPGIGEETRTLTFDIDRMSITYRELNEKANQLAHFLREKGVGRDTIVGIMVLRSIEMVIGIYCILKAGGAYLPIDPDYPGNRIAAMKESSKGGLVLTTDEIAANKSDLFSTMVRKPEILLLEELAGKPPKQSTGNLEPVNSPESLIYVIFTSGSTGKPKGAGVYHRGFSNLMHWFVAEFELGSHDRNILLTSLNFDLTQKNLYTPLITRGTLCLQEGDYFDPGSILEDIHEHGVTWVNCTPGMFNKVVEYEESTDGKHLSTLRYVFLGGEPISINPLLNWLESKECKAEIVNTYGPTECSDICASYRIRQPRRFLKEIIPVGKPIYNVHLYIVNKSLQPVPVGVMGELLIGGEGVGCGYINDEDLTQRKFIHHTFYPGNPEQLLYCTGDLVKWLYDGHIEFIGRNDQQVKIRGFRVEIGEIENQLLNHKAITQAAVILREDFNDKYLCAYVVLEQGKIFDQAHLDRELREHLALTLPDYMLPSFFVPMGDIPLTSNGKVNRKSLPEPGMKRNKEYVAPGNYTEKKMMGIWYDVLGIDAANHSGKKTLIGVHDNFFDLGGHSLKATILAARIHKEFDVIVPLAQIFKKPTINGLAGYIKNRSPNKYAKLQVTEKKEYYPSSLTQKRFYILQSLAPENTAYNLQLILVLKGRPDKEKLGETIGKLIKRHESLRTSFDLIDGEPVQKIHKEAKINTEFYQAPNEKIKEIVNIFVKPFDLGKIPLIRVGLIKVTEIMHFLMVDMHHIITDGLSSVILSTEFTAIYEGEELLPLKIQYRDFSEWQHTKTEKERVEKQGEFWLKQFEQRVSPLNLPTNYKRPAIKSFAGSTLSFEINEKDTNALRDLIRHEGVSLFIVLFSIYNLMLWKLTGQVDIIIGTGVLSRGHADLMNIIGLFFNTIPLRIPIAEEKCFQEYLMDVKEFHLQALENQEYPVDTLIESLLARELLKRDPGRNPLFDTMFAIQNFRECTEFLTEVELSGLKIKPYRLERRKSRFDLFLVGTEGLDSIQMDMEYSTVLFKPSTARKIAGYYLKILKQVLANKNIKMRDITIPSDFDKVKFNADQTEYTDFGF